MNKKLYINKNICDTAPGNGFRSFNSRLRFSLKEAEGQSVHGEGASIKKVSSQTSKCSPEG